MRRAVLLAFVGFLVHAHAVRADGVPNGLAERAWAIMDAVLDHHVSAPTRQQMMLDGLRALYKAAGATQPPGLARRTSAATSADQFAALVDEAWRARSNTKGAAKPDIEELFTSALLRGVPGGARLISAKDLRVEQQLAANQYVGLQIALSFNDDVHRPEIAEVFSGGPADRAGVLKGDLIEEIDGTTTAGLELRAVVDRLRGPEGTDVTIRVQQGKAAPRTYKITRGVLPRKTIEGIRSFGGPGGETLVDGPGLIGYLRFTEIAGSTPHELRQLARTLEDEGTKALVLDVRGMTEARFHPALLVADELLDGGVIGGLRTVKGVETYRAEPDVLFRDWPLAVLIDADTAGVTAWLAAGLKDNHRAVVIAAAPGRLGSAADGDLAGVQTAVPIGDGSWSVEMMTGQLERADGRPLARHPFVENNARLRRRKDAAGMDREPDGSLVPDVVVAPSGPARGGLPRLGLGRRDTPPAEGDTVTSAALQRMREALKLRPLRPNPGVPSRLTQRDEVRP